MSTQVIRQEVTFPTTPVQVYKALTDAAAFSRMTGGAPAAIEGHAGGEFSCFGGMVHGRQIECVPGTRLVQAWRAKSWEPGQYSIARFELRAEGSGTRLVFEHAGFPEGQAEHLAQGWQANYWQPLQSLAE